MRNILVLIGPPYSGKSTFVKDNNLEDYTISLDNLRVMFSGRTIDAGGNLIINDSRSQGKVIDTFNSILETRLNQGLFTVVDNTNLDNKSLIKIYNYSKSHGYNLYFKDFREVSLDILLERKDGRLDSYINKSTLLRLVEKGKKLIVSNKFKEIQDLKDIKDSSGPNLLENLESEYKSIYFIGDIHGCLEPLKEFMDINYNKDSLYIFTGDYIDRGENHKGVLRLLYEKQREGNIILLEGNHEKWLRFYSNNSLDKIRSKEFNSNTLPELRDPVNGVYTVKESKSFVNKLKIYSYIEFHGKIIFASHGGVSKIRNSISNYKSKSANYYISGSGNYGDLLELYNTQNQSPDFIVHGHRNIDDNPGDGKYINLEGRIDTGGELRYVEFKYEDKEVKVIRGSVNSEFDYKVLPSRLISNLDNSSLVNSKVLSNGTVSYFINREVFTGRKWDNLNVKARGLFIYKDTTDIAARSYDKFFNIGELTTKFPDLTELGLTLPLVGYEKGNGYLGIVSWNKVKDELIICSKSTNEGTYAEYFQGMIFDYIDKVKLVDYLKINNVSFVFEVISPSWDPHVINYKRDELILLDVIKNEFKLSKLDYNELIEIHKEITLGKSNFRCKKLLYKFDTLNELTETIKSIKSHEIEGLVIEDSNNKMIKYKNSWFMVKRILREYDKRLRKGIPLSTEGIKNKLITQGYVKGLGSEEVKSKLEYTEILSIDDIHELVEFTENTSSRLDTNDFIKEFDTLMNELIRRNE